MVPSLTCLGCKEVVMDNRRLATVLKRVFTPYRLSVYKLLKERAVAESATYAEQHLSTAMIFASSEELWDYAASSARIEGGAILEFGVFKGRSINHFADIFKSETLHGFDSFEGLAEDWTGYHLPKGTFDLGGHLPKVKENVTLHKGWFDATLPLFLEKNTSNIRLCHVDCDTYESSLFVLEHVAARLVKGSIVLFDEYYGYPNWRFGEFRAWQEVCAKKGLSYRYIAFSEMQVAVEIQ